jgi:hypothetical protein
MRTFTVILLALLATAARASAAVTFSADVAPIVYANCVSCHRTGEVAPFPLVSYDDVRKHAKQIAAVTASRYMPPWKPQPGWGHFVGERRLTDAQIKTLADWATAGAPQGDPAATPPVPTFSSDWRLGKPDLVVKMDKPFTIPADGDHGRDMYRAFVVPLNLDKDQYVTAVEFRPDSRTVLHHALFFLDTGGAGRRKEAQERDGQPGFKTFGGPGVAVTGGLGGWAPGAMPEPLPEGWARLARKGADLILQCHFHPTGKVETEQATLALYFSKTVPDRIVGGGNVHTFAIDIPPGDANYVREASYTVPVDVDVIGLTPHAHLLCKDMKGWATLPDGTRQNLIWIADWDFNWQGSYEFDKPVRLPAGTVVHMRYTYDNSADNERNPNVPPKRVHFGEQTTDEMAFLFMEVSPVRKSDWPALKRGNRRQMLDALTRFAGGRTSSDHADTPP